VAVAEGGAQQGDLASANVRVRRTPHPAGRGPCPEAGGSGGEALAARSARDGRSEGSGERKIDPVRPRIVPQRGQSSTVETFAAE